MKYGFIYIWRDRKRKMYYIGCHWGTEGDGYICSSKRMRNAYAYRREDFKRRVVQRVYTNRQDLLEVEHQWLALIPDEELGKQYYNMTKRHFGHWTANDNVISVREKISSAVKKAHADGKMEASKHLRLAALKRRGESWRKNSSAKTAQMNRDRIYDDATRDTMRRTGEQNPWTGCIWITDGKASTRVKKDDVIPDGWRKGRIRGHRTVE